MLQTTHKGYIDRLHTQGMMRLGTSVDCPKDPNPLSTSWGVSLCFLIFKSFSSTSGDARIAYLQNASQAQDTWLVPSPNEACSAM